MAAVYTQRNILRSLPPLPHPFEFIIIIVYNNYRISTGFVFTICRYAIRSLKKITSLLLLLLRNLKFFPLLTKKFMKKRTLNYCDLRFQSINFYIIFPLLNKTTGENFFFFFQKNNFTHSNYFSL